MSAQAYEEGDPSIDLMDAYADFVLDIRIVGKIGGVGVPTVPIRVPQLVEYDSHLKRQRISFSRLVDIVNMVSSTQQSFHRGYGGGDNNDDSSNGNGDGSKKEQQKQPHSIKLAYSNPQTQKVSEIDSAEELLDVMEQNKSLGQLTLVATIGEKVNGNTAKIESTPSGTETAFSSSDFPSSVPNGALSFPPVQKAPKLGFAPPKFTTSCGDDDNAPASNGKTMMNLMEQLLEVQTSRMQQFADYMENRFGQLIEQRIVSSEENMKHCLKETVQLLDVKEDDDVTDSSDDNDGYLSGRNVSSLSNLEKNVKDHMVSMELRFAKLEDQYAQTASLAKLPGNTQAAAGSTDETISVYERLDRLENRMDERFGRMEQLMLSLRQDTETARNATIAAFNSPARQSRQPSQSRGSNSKPPLPPQHRAAPEPPLLLPRLEPSLPPVSPTVLSTPLPPSIPSSPRPQSPMTVPYLPQHRSSTPIQQERTSLPGSFPFLDPMSPPESEYSRYSSGDDDDDEDETPLSSIQDRKSSISMPSLASISSTHSGPSRGSELDTTPSYSNIAQVKSTSYPPSSEHKMKQVIKDHMESMESRVSKLRELNSTSATPTTAANTVTPGTASVMSEKSSTPRTLFHHPSDNASVEQLETQFATMLDELSTSLQATIQDTTRETVDHKLVDLEKLLQTKLEEISGAVCGSQKQQNKDATPVNPRRKASTTAETTSLELPMHSLEQVARYSTDEQLGSSVAARVREDLEELLSAFDAKTKDSVDSAKQGWASILPELKFLVEKRMDDMETLVQDTAHDITRNSKTIQVRLQQALMDQILDALDPVIDKILNESRGSKGDFSMATSAYATVYGDEPSEVTIDQTVQMRSAHSSGQPSGKSEPVFHDQRDLVAMDREASVFNIYGDMDIDDHNDNKRGDHHNEARGNLDTYVGRGKSLRNLCDINTIEEVEEEEWSNSFERSAHTKKSVEESIATARSESLRNIYGDAIDIDDGHKDAPPTPVHRKDTDENCETPVTQNRTITDSNLDEKRDDHEKLSSSFVYGNEDIGENEEEETAQFMDATTLYEDVAIDGNQETNDLQSSNSYEACTVHSALSHGNIDSVHDVPPTAADSNDFDYDDVGIDVDDEKRRSSLPSGPPLEDIYDELSLDGVDDSKRVDIGSEDSFDSLDELGSRSGSDSATAETGGLENLDESSYASSGYDSESSKEDEEFFHDHARQHLAVLASAMSRIRQAEKGTKRYSRFKDDIFTARRKGPLSTKVKEGNKGVTDDYSESTHVYDDSSLRDEHSQPDGDDHFKDESTGTGDPFLRDGYNQSDGDVCYEEESTGTGMSRDNSLTEYDRSKEKRQEKARIIAKAIAKYSVTKRAAKDYRRVLLRKFATNRGGPLALAENEGDGTTNGDSTTGRSCDDEYSTTKHPQRQSDFDDDQYDDDYSNSSYTSHEGGSNSDQEFPTRVGQDGKATDYSEQGVQDSAVGKDESLDNDAARQRYDGYQSGNVEAGQDTVVYDDDGNMREDADQKWAADNGGYDRMREGAAHDSGSVEAGASPSKPYCPSSTATDSLIPDCGYESDGQPDEKIDGNDGDHFPFRCAYVEAENGVFRRVDVPLEEIYETDESVKTEVTKHSVGGSSYVEIRTRGYSHSLFRRVDVAARAGNLDDSDESSSASDDEHVASEESQSKMVYARSLEEDESLNSGFAVSSPAEVHEKPVQVISSVNGGAQQDESGQWDVTTSVVPSQEELYPESSIYNASDPVALSEEEAQKPKRMPRRPTADYGAECSDSSSDELGDRPTADYGAESSDGSGDETGDETDNRKWGVAEVAGYVLNPLEPSVEYSADPEGKEIEEWEKVRSQSTGAAKDFIQPGESKSVYHEGSERALLLDHVHEIKTQIQQWEEKFLASNDTLRNSVHESIEDRHHFATYLDKMLTDRIGQLEEVIRAQIHQNNLEVISSPRSEPVVDSPPRTGSAPLTPMRDLLGSTSEREGQFTQEESKRDVVSSMMVTVEEWKRLQDKLRGTEEVAEGYRKQVLQLRNVLEVKINEGNASLHQVEVLQRKLQEAHEREIQAQKQLRPVTRRVEQVIQEMVELEEQSEHLQMENGRLREMLWMANRAA